MIPVQKIYSADESKYDQISVSKRLEAFFLANVGLVVTREQIIDVARDPKTGKEPENWHQRLSELRTDKGYTILSRRDWSALSGEEYCLASVEVRKTAARRVRPSAKCWSAVLQRADHKCEWQEDGLPCGLAQGAIDPVGGGTVKLTPDHKTPHSVKPDTDTENPEAWQALCGRHQVMKKNFWDSATGKVNIIAILQAAGLEQKREALSFLQQYLGGGK